jgi:hypothetical protein
MPVNSQILISRRIANWPTRKTDNFTDRTRTFCLFKGKGLPVWFTEALYFVSSNWLRGLDLNQRPSGYEPDELPDCSTPRKHLSGTGKGRQICDESGRGNFLPLQAPVTVQTSPPGVSNAAFVY